MGKLFGGLLAVVALIAIVCVGGYFALKRNDIPYAALEAKYATPTSQYVHLPSGVHMHYRDEGQREGPTIVLVHGFSVSSDSWRPWIEPLGEQYHVVSMDLPGHGLTRAPANYHPSIEAYRDTLAEFVASQHLTKFALAGNSMGGNIAWEYALAHPDQLDALILVDASGWPQNSSAVNPTVKQLLANPMTGPLLRDLDNTAMMRRGLRATFADPALADDAMVTRYADYSRAPGHRDMLVRLTLDFSSRNFATRERLAALHMPTLILVGAHDHLVPPEHAELFHRAIAGSELVRFDDSGHMPQLERSEQSATAVQEFLYRIHEGSALAAE